MAKLARRTIERNSIRRIAEKAEARAEEIAQFIVDEIATNPTTPDSRRTGTDHGRSKPERLHLRNSYYVRKDPITGDSLIMSKRRYWVYVEFGTGRGDEQPHLRPAIETARREFA